MASRSQWRVATIMTSLSWHPHKAHESRLLVYRHPPASLFYTFLHPHQNFIIFKISLFLQVLALLNINFYFSKHKTESIIGAKTGGLIVDLPFMPLVWIIALRENYFVVNIRSGGMEIYGYQWLVILHHKYGLIIRSSLNNWYQSDVPEPFTDNLQTNNLCWRTGFIILSAECMGESGKLLLQNELLLQTNVTIHACGIPGKQWKGEEFCSCWGRPEFILDKMSMQGLLCLWIKFIYLLFMFLVHTHASKWFILA